MKVLNLLCDGGHAFEGWFASNEAFDAQLAQQLVACPMCGSTGITKGLSAPRLNLGAGQPAAAAPSNVARAPAELEARWMRAVREVLANTEDVGARFADEARKIHYGEAQERGIRGQATPAQTVELLEEGIGVLPLPLPPALKETLQ